MAEEKRLNDVEEMHQTQFYEKAESGKLTFSATGMQLILTDPKSYHHQYVLGNFTDTDRKHFDEGNLIHSFVLEPENVNDKYVNMGVRTPSDSGRDLVTHLLSLDIVKSTDLTTYEDEILYYLKEINLHQSLVDDKKAPFKTGDQKRLEKMLNESNIEYFQLMCESREKVIVDSNSWTKCYEKAEAILEDEEVKKLMFPENDSEQCRSELKLEYKPEGFKYTLKGILDRIKAIPAEKKFIITDLKHTNGTLEGFKDSIERYGYWRQAAIYFLLAQVLKQKGAASFEIEFNFTVVTSLKQVYPYKVTPESMTTWIERLKEEINVKVDYHIQNKSFKLPYEFANNLVVL